MICPHCNNDSKAKVIHTRRIDGDIYRERGCEHCKQRFVSIESPADPDMTFPWGEVSRIRRDKKLDKQKFDTGNLDFSIFKVWS